LKSQIIISVSLAKIQGNCSQKMASQIPGSSPKLLGSINRRDSVISVIYHQLSVNTQAILDGNDGGLDSENNDKSMKPFYFK
jgi:hypothetical protein